MWWSPEFIDCIVILIGWSSAQFVSVASGYPTNDKSSVPTIIRECRHLQKEKPIRRLRDKLTEYDIYSKRVCALFHTCVHKWCNIMPSRCGTRWVSVCRHTTCVWKSKMRESATPKGLGRIVSVEILKWANNTHDGLLLQEHPCSSGVHQTIVAKRQCDQQLQDHRTVDSDSDAGRASNSVWVYAEDVFLREVNA